MFDSYEEIFAQRAHSYHKAMADMPDARELEFQAAVRHLEIEERHTVCDVPAGGGYLKRYINEDSVELHFLETSHHFASHCPVEEHCKTDICSFERLPVTTGSIDRALCLAALHHVEQPEQFFQELKRVLRPDGRLVIADVQANTGPAEFLNIFVDQHNSMGHQGVFLTDDTVKLLEASGFSISAVVDEKYPWRFSSDQQMTSFARNLFGLDEATDAEILEGIERYLGVSRRDTGAELNWQLTFISALPVAKEHG